MNVLFLMADPLLWDHLSCAGHPHLQTPNLDALAARGVRFSLAYLSPRRVRPQPRELVLRGTQRHQAAGVFCGRWLSRKAAQGPGRRR